MSTLAYILEWSGVGASLWGAYTLAGHTKRSRLGWIGFLVSNLLLLVLFIMLQRWGMVLQQCGFTVTSVMGLKRSGLLDDLFLSARSQGRSPSREVVGHD